MNTNKGFVTVEKYNQVVGKGVTRYNKAVGKLTSAKGQIWEMKEEMETLQTYACMWEENKDHAFSKWKDAWRDMQVLKDVASSAEVEANNLGVRVHNLERTNQDMTERNAQILQEFKERASEHAQQRQEVQQLEEVNSAQVEELQRRVSQLADIEKHLGHSKVVISTLTLELEETKEQVVHQVELSTTLFERSYFCA